MGDMAPGAAGPLGLDVGTGSGAKRRGILLMNRTIVILLVRHPSRPVAAARKHRRALRHHPVTVTKAPQKEVTEWDEYTGRLAAVDEVEVRAQVGGYLESIHFKDGQTGKEGDLLLSSIRALAHIGLEGIPTWFYSQVTTPMAATASLTCVFRRAAAELLSVTISKSSFTILEGERTDYASNSSHSENPIRDSS